MTDSAITRAPTGQFLPGSRANPDGRPKGSRNKITELRQAMEIAVREGMNPDEITEVMQTMVDMARLGSVKAAKLVLDKAVANVSDPRDDAAPEQPQYVFLIQNATINPKQEALSPVTPSNSAAQVVDAEFSDVTVAQPANSTPTPTNISQMELFPL